MKRYRALAAAAVLGLVVVVTLRGGIGWAQSPGDDDANAPRSSSARILEGMQVRSPPDQPSEVDPADVAAAAVYNASLCIVGSALRPRESDVEWAISTYGGCIYAASGDGQTFFNTPVYLPQGATVKYLRMYYDDRARQTRMGCSPSITSMANPCTSGPRPRPGASGGTLEPPGVHAHHRL